ncbi:MAG: 2-dehydropantoate 2-reductase [Alphaproteobacteria bacterium]|jgi:2-dehydropantoate 2-reductase|nr:2-dehydropantoate 2-reductase [Alphaproteobacteria bacterium]
MKIAIMGTGGMGAYYGANLAAIGRDVAFIARGAHLEAIKRDGLLLTGDAGDRLIKSAKASDDPRDIGPVDVVLFCVKLYDVEAAAEAIRPLLHDQTAVISVLNGVDGPERIAAVIGEGHVLGGAAYASAVIERPGVVSYKSTMASLVIGALDGGDDPRAEAFRQVCEGAAFSCSVSANILGVLWDKFTLLATNASLCGVCRLPVASIYAEPALVDLARAMMEEITAVARARGIAFTEDIVESSVARSKAFPPDMYASMYHDLARGRPMELEGLSGTVARLGAEVGVATPNHQALYACLKPFMNGAPA